MKRELSFAALALLLAGGASAAPLTPEEAVARLQNSADIATIGTRASDLMQLKYTLKATDGIPSVYVFDQGETGFMILSADDVARPLLGYSDTGVFDPDNMPPALQGWLDGYRDQIQYMRLTGVTATAGENNITLPNWAPVAPMIKTTWDQNRPYNLDCPKVGNTACPTGCVATAMAQVMNYFKYPETGQGKISYQINLGTQYQPNMQTLSIDFGQTTFDWANMLNNYPVRGGYTDEQAEAVATLMKACGYSVQMNYNTSQSGAVSGYIPGALQNYFKYDPSVMYISRSQKTYTEWATLIYNNLKNIGPVIYDGDTAMSGGHSFVCDGYQGNGYFHFNWGWSGVSDGYYLLDALNPSALGTGGAAGGFNFRQDVVINIQKPKAGSTPTGNEVVLSGSLYGTASSAYLYMRINGNQYPGFRYYGNSEIVFDLGAQIVEADNPNATPEYITVANSVLKNYPLDPGYVCFCNGTGQYPFPMVQLSKLNMKDNVKYKVTCAYQPVGGDWQVASASVGCYNYFYVTKNGSDYNFENFDVMEFDCTELEPETQLYDGIAGQFNLTLKNEEDTELTRGVMMYLMDSPEENANVLYYSDSFVQTLAPGETFSTTWTTPLSSVTNSTLRVPTEFYMALYDMDTDMIYYIDENPVTMNTYPGKPSFNVAMQIDDANQVNGIYQVQNSQDFQVTTSINVTSGIFSEDVKLYVGADAPNNRISLLLTYPLERRVINAGDSSQYVTDINFPGAEIGTVYYLIILVGDADRPSAQLAFTALTNEAGVESLVTEPANGVYTVYNLQGVKVLETLDASRVNSLPRGVYVVNGKKVFVR